MTTNTPVEWKLYGDFAFWMAGADSSGRNWQRPVLDRYGRLVATATGGTEKEANVNALLISAAPDLLAALKDMRDNVRDESPKMWERVDSAIEKAGG